MSRKPSVRYEDEALPEKIIGRQAIRYLPSPDGLCLAFWKKDISLIPTRQGRRRRQEPQQHLTARAVIAKGSGH